MRSDPSLRFEATALPEWRAITLRATRDGFSALVRHAQASLRVPAPNLEAIEQLHLAARIEPAYTIAWLDLNTLTQLPEIASSLEGAQPVPDATADPLVGAASLDFYGMRTPEKIARITQWLESEQGKRSPSAQRGWLLARAQMAAHLLRWPLAQASLEQACALSPGQEDPSCKAAAGFKAFARRVAPRPYEGAQGDQSVHLVLDQGKLHIWGPYPLTPHRLERAAGAMKRPTRDDGEARVDLQFLDYRFPTPVLIGHMEPARQVADFLSRASHSEERDGTPLSVVTPAADGGMLTLRRPNRSEEAPSLLAVVDEHGVRLATSPKQAVTRSDCKGMQVCFSQPQRAALAALGDEPRVFHESLGKVQAAINPEALAPALPDKTLLQVELRPAPQMPWGLVQDLAHKIVVAAGDRQVVFLVRAPPGDVPR